MTTPSAAARPGPPAPAALSRLPELPDGLRRPRLLQLTDADAVTHGLVDSTASNEAVRLRRTCVAASPGQGERYAH